MVTRLYFCKNCDHEFETVQPMHEKLKRKCPQCGKLKLEQDLSGGFEPTIKKYNTVGSIAEKNTKNLGIYGREDREKQIHDKDKKMIAERKRKIENAGYKNYEPKKSSNFISKLLKD